MLRTRTYRIRQVAKPVVTHSGLLVSGTWIQVVIISGIPESGLPYIGGAYDTQLFTLILMSDDDSFSGCRLQIWTRLLKVTFRTTPVSGQTITSQFLGFNVITFKLAVTLYSSLLVFLTCPF